MDKKTIYHQKSPALKNVIYYRAPKDRKINPARISNDCERTEIITGGRVWHEDENGGKYYGRGTIFRHREGDFTVHKFEPDNPYRCLVFHFEGVGNSPYTRVSRWTIPETLSIFRHEVLSAFHNPDRNINILRDYTWSTVNWHNTQSTSQIESDEIPLPIQQALSYMNKHPESNISVEQLAEIANYSKAHFHSLFKKYFAMTPHQYHLRQRIRLACQQLATSSTPIAEIGAIHGFESLENFYRAFQRLMKTSPAEYRKKHTFY